MRLRCPMNGQPEVFFFSMFVSPQKRRFVPKRGATLIRNRPPSTNFITSGVFSLMVEQEICPNSRGLFTDVLKVSIWGPKYIVSSYHTHGTPYLRRGLHVRVVEQDAQGFLGHCRSIFFSPLVQIVVSHATSPLGVLRCSIFNNAFLVCLVLCYVRRPEFKFLVFSLFFLFCFLFLINCHCLFAWPSLVVCFINSSGALGHQTNECILSNICFQFPLSLPEHEFAQSGGIFFLLDPCRRHHHQTGPRRLRRTSEPRPAQACNWRNFNAFSLCMKYDTSRTAPQLLMLFFLSMNDLALSGLFFSPSNISSEDHLASQTRHNFFRVMPDISTWLFMSVSQQSCPILSLWILVGFE